MKYVILIYSNPQPWGHPTSDYLEIYQTLSTQQRGQLDREFDELLTELSSSGELVGGEALGAPSTSRLYRWDENSSKLMTAGPYAEGNEHLAGFFLIDVSDQQRAEEIAAKFSGPGETVELRPAFSPDSDS